MAARAIEYCEAVKAYLEQQQTQGTYSFSFLIQRANPSRYELSATNSTIVFLYPGPEGPNTGTRRQWRHTYTVVLHVVNFVDSNTQDEIDDVYQLLQEITDSMKDAVISGHSLLEFGTEDNPEELLIPQSLHNRNVAQAPQRMIYQEMR